MWSALSLHYILSSKLLESNLSSQQGPCPSFFQALCFAATQGGTRSYEWAGHGPVRALGGTCPDEMEYEEWEVELIDLNTLITEGHGLP